MLKLLKNEYLLVGAILLLGFFVRVYKIDNPLADWHSWRQADTASVARNFYKEGFNPLLPKYDDMSGVAENPIPNPQRFRFVEFPIYPSFIYFAYLINGAVDEKLARLINIFFSLGSIIFLFLITKRYFNIPFALLAALLYTLLPFNIYYSRAILPEASLVFFSLGMFYFVDLWIYQNSKNLYLLALFFTTCAFLTKPMAIFYLLPLIHSYYQKEKKWWPIPRRYFTLFIPSFLPFIFWRIWMLQHPEGIPASNWLLNGTGIRFRPAFFRWIISERLGGIILTVPGFVLFIIGVLIKPLKKESALFYWLALSAALYLIIFATGNVQHDYYQYLIVPILIILTVRGFTLLLKGLEVFIPRLLTIPLGVLFLFLIPYLGWIEVKGFYQINNPKILEAGKKADQILPKEAVVVAPYNGDTAFLYQTNRVGWPFLAYPIEDLIKNFGVTHYVSINFDEVTKKMMVNYDVLEVGSNYVIVDLTKPNLK